MLITGGAGYIGTALCEGLAEVKEIEEIIVYDNLSRQNYNLLIGLKKLDHRFRFVQGDILDSRNLRKVVKEADVVFHLAAKVTTPFADQDAHLFEQINHWGTAELSYAVEESEVQKLIYLSSVSVYGSSDDAKNVEALLNPKTFYGISKMRGEEHVLRLGDKLQSYVIRCGNVYGYNKSMRFDAVINKLLFEANFHGRINVHGNGAQHRPFVYINTVKEALLNILLGDTSTGVSNLVEHNFSVNDIVQVLRQSYPELEVIFINNNLKMRELMVETSTSNLASPSESLDVLSKRLESFKAAFAF